MTATDNKTHLLWVVLLGFTSSDIVKSMAELRRGGVRFIPNICTSKVINMKEPYHLSFTQGLRHPVTLAYRHIAIKSSKSSGKESSLVFPVWTPLGVYIEVLSLIYRLQPSDPGKLYQVFMTVVFAFH